MKAIIIFLSLLSFIGCVSLEDAYQDARKTCTHLMHDKGIDITKTKSVLKQKAYTDCVAQTANAKANVSKANAIWWVGIVLAILVGLGTGIS